MLCRYLSCRGPAADSPTFSARPAAFAFVGGILLVFLKYPFFGVLIEMFGFLNLFGYVSLRSSSPPPGPGASSCARARSALGEGLGR